MQGPMATEEMYMSQKDEVKHGQNNVVIKLHNITLLYLDFFFKQLAKDKMWSS